MTDRERLIELIRKSYCVDTWNYYTDDFKEPNPIETLADYLLANGVIVPPCKAGDTVYKTVHYKNLTSTPPIPVNIVGFHLGKFPNLRGHKRKEYLIGYDNVTHSLLHLDIEEIGKTVFLTKEEAEQALLRKEDEGK